MPEFLFAATDGSGQQVQGKATAADMATAVAYVASQGFTLLHIELVPAEQTLQPTPNAAPALQQTQPLAPAASSVVKSPATAPAPTVPEPVSPASESDILKTDAARRRKLELELQGMGMSADEINRLINANATSYEADPNSIMAGLALTAAPATPTRGTVKRAAAAASLEQFAAQLTEQQAKKNKESVALAAVNLQLPEFRQASVQDSIKAEPLLREANMLRKAEKHKLAEQKVREALQYTPQDASALEMLGDILQSVGRVDEALAAYKRATEADAKRASAEKKYGDLLMRQRNWDIGDPEQVTVNNRAAVLLSLLFPGIGQVLNGELIKGFVFLALDAGCLYLLLFSNIPIVARKFHPTAAGYMCAGLALLLWLGSAIDMNASAKKRSGL
jgi:tetratricopeptide (TPR) repeat protein